MNTPEEPSLFVTTPSAPRPAAGAVPAGYEIIAVLSRAGVVVSYRARQVALRRLCALTMIEAGGGDAERGRLLTEAEALSKVKHPGLPQVYEIGSHDGLPYLSLELCDGDSLADRLRLAPLPPREAALLMEQVARAVQAAHQAGIAHHGLKPDNVLLGREEHPLVIGFGLAKPAEGGSPSVADVLALGAMLSECLAGRPPSDDRNEGIIDVPSPIRPLPKRVPRDLEAICGKCLDREPAKRYASAADVADDLRRYLDGRAVTARPPGRLERVGRWCRREPMKVALLALVLVALAACVVTSSVFATRASRATKQADEAHHETEMVRHAVRMNLAMQAWERHDVAEAEAILEEVPEHLQQAWEVRYLRSLCRRKVLTIRLDSWSESVAYSPDGSRIAGTDSGVVKVWDVATGRQVLALQKSGIARGDVVFSPDGSRIASCLSSGKVQVWDAKTGEDLHSFVAGEYVTRIAYSHDGTRIVGRADGKLKVWDARSGETRLVLAPAAPKVAFNVAYSPDGSQIAAGGEIWDATTGKKLRSLGGKEKRLKALAYSPDGSRIVSGGSRGVTEPGEVKVWDARTGQELLNLVGHTAGVRSVAYSPDGTRIVSGGDDRTLRVWDARTGRCVFTMTGHERHVKALAFSPDGSRIASAGNDRTLKIWDARVKRELLTLQGHSDEIRAVACSSSPERVASGSRDGTVKVWDVASGKQLLTVGHGAYVSAVAFSPDGTRIASTGQDRTIKVWDAGAGRRLLTLQGHSGWVGCVAYSPDGRRIVSGSWDRTLKVWDARTGQELLTIKGHAHEVHAVAYSPDGKRIVSGSDPIHRKSDVPTLKIWDADTGKELLSFHESDEDVWAVAFSPDGGHVLSTGRYVLQVWDAKTGEKVRTLEGHREYAPHATYSPDGSRIISEGKTLAIWDARSGQCLLTGLGHTDGVVFSRDGNRIIGSSDRTVKIWDADPEDLAPSRLAASLDWHREQADDAQNRNQHFVAAFHLEQLLRLQPDDADVRNRLLAAMKQAQPSPAVDAVRRRFDEREKQRQPKKP